MTQESKSSDCSPLISPTHRENLLMVQALEAWLAAHNPTETLIHPGGEASISASFDGGKTFEFLGNGCIGEVRFIKRDEDLAE